ncbi:MAG TPA: DUF6159 family protein [Puia sp.]|nr:DUF6159 family protein [Puia sp.]
MNFFTRLSNGWNLSMNSFAVLKANRQLILFPILSGLSMLLIVSSFFLFLFASSDWDITALDTLNNQGTVANYLLLFGYYVVNYFIIVFFNTALIHCTRLYFQGRRPTVGEGLGFALTRIGAIFAWAVFAATVGTILRIIQDRVGFLGKIVTSLIGAAWSIATFFVVPVIAYENLGPLGAFRRSATLMKEKWGESIGATFSFGIIQLLGLFLLAIPSMLLFYFVHPLAGIALFLLGLFAVTVIFSATRVIFVSAVYHDINGDPVKNFNQKFSENLFLEK